MQVDFDFCLLRKSEASGHSTCRNKDISWPLSLRRDLSWQAIAVGGKNGGEKLQQAVLRELKFPVRPLLMDYLFDASVDITGLLDGMFHGASDMRRDFFHIPEALSRHESLALVFFGSVTVRNCHLPRNRIQFLISATGSLCRLSSRWQAFLLQTPIASLNCRLPYYSRVRPRKTTWGFQQKSQRPEYRHPGIA